MSPGAGTHVCLTLFAQTKQVGRLRRISLNDLKGVYT